MATPQITSGMNFGSKCEARIVIPTKPAKQAEMSTAAAASSFAALR